MINPEERTDEERFAIESALNAASLARKYAGLLNVTTDPDRARLAFVLEKIDEVLFALVALDAVDRRNP